MSLLLLLSCRHPAPTTSITPDTAVPRTSAPTGGTGGTATTADTGPLWPAWATDYPLPMLDPGFLIVPSVRVIGFPRSNIRRSGLVPTYGGEVGMLAVNGSGAEYTGLPIPGSFFLPGDLPRGDHRLFEVWDNVSGHENVLDHSLGWTGDLNGDGHRDFWIHGILYEGPALGRRLPAWPDHSEAVAWIEEYEGSFSELTPASGEVDADGDGTLDVVFQDLALAGYVHYGPFAGGQRAGFFDDHLPSTARLGDAWWASPSLPVLLPDHFGPGHPAVALSQCYEGPGAFLFDLAGVRGRDVGYEESFARTVDGFGGGIADASDLDGDGTGDVMLFMIKGTPLAGPVSGLVHYDLPPVFEVVNGDISAVLGDINADGVKEMLAAGGGTYYILFSPYGSVVDVTRGLPFAEEPMAVYPPDSVDLDGDGLAEVVSDDPWTVNEMGEVRIWYGSDLLAAWTAQREGR